ncbi:MerR family transcriptional regulator [Thiofaba sp. EF100]|uniref:MerR family transcriptional regulator n=1 Tax=Thiofaba sp. EF100 TaxID=3121274 RepID=UPI0032216D4B
MFTIQMISDEIGVPADTLRKWEQRYGFPRPGRTEGGFRLYSARDLRLLRSAKALLDQGMRPGQVFRSLSASVEGIEAAAADSPDGVIRELLDLLRQDRLDALRQRLELDSMALDVLGFIESRIVPLMRSAGDAWATGELPVFREHALSMIVQSLLEQRVSSVPEAQARSRVLLATPSGELHALGLAAAKAVLSGLRCQCIDLGPNLPLDQLLASVKSFRPDAIGLSISCSYAPGEAQAYVSALCDSVCPRTEVWLGGGGIVRIASLPEGVFAFEDLMQLSAHVLSHLSRG